MSKVNFEIRISLTMKDKSVSSLIKIKIISNKKMSSPEIAIEYDQKKP